MVKNDDGTTSATDSTEQGGSEERAPRTRLGRRIRVFPPKAARRAGTASEALPGLQAEGPAALAVLEDVPANDEARPGELNESPETEAATADAAQQDADPAGDDAGDDTAAADDISGAQPVATEPTDGVEQSASAAASEIVPPTGRSSAPRRPASFSLLFKAPPTPTVDPAAVQAEPAHDEDEDSDDRDAASDSAADSSPSRRSRRRSRGHSAGSEESGGEPETEVVSRARPQRELITEPQKLKGSTRLEAKRQRRRDGRDAGRRRTVVTEAEFLARREAVDRVMIVRSDETYIEIGVLEDGILAEHYLAKNANLSLIGNVYLGRVQNVLPSMEAAFVDIGRGRNAVLYSGEVDWDAASERLGDKGSQARRIELALKSGDKVLVQVTKDPIGHKGSRLTSSISLPGRYLVYVPNGSMNGISRKLPDTERARLKRILKDALPDSAGVIVRTAAEGAAEEQLTVDVQRLANQWAEIDHLAETATAPALLHSEPDLLVKIVRDVFNEDFAKLVIAGDDARATIERYLGGVAPELLDRVERWEGNGDVFAAYRVGEQIEKALDRKVWLPSGGSLVIDRTEAMTVIDVNTGKFVGSGGNLEETVTKNNLEAAEEIVRQLRLRDIGGIIVVDFIDMVLESNRDLVMRRLVECLSRDRTKHQVAEVTSLGLVQMTRKRLGIGLAESMSDETVAADNRPDPQAPGRRRRGGGQQEKQQAQRLPGSTHVITDGAKTALAQIAGATIVTPTTTTMPTSTRADQEPEALGAPSEATSAPGGSRPERSSRRASRSATQPAVSQPEPQSVPEPQPVPEPRSAPEAQSQALPEPARPTGPLSPSGPLAPSEPSSPAGPPAPPEPQTAPAGEIRPEPMIELPTAAVPPERPKRIDEAAAGLLDSVLGALPEPKRPGQGRRSRRVSTPALTPKQQD